MDGSVLAFLKYMDGSVCTHLNGTYGSVWSHLRFCNQSATTRFPQSGYSGVCTIAIMQEKQQNFQFMKYWFIFLSRGWQAGLQLEAFSRAINHFISLPVKLLLGKHPLAAAAPWKTDVVAPLWALSMPEHQSSLPACPTPGCTAEQCTPSIYCSAAHCWIPVYSGVMPSRLATHRHVAWRKAKNTRINLMQFLIHISSCRLICLELLFMC